MVKIKTDTSIDAMREAGRIVAQALTAVREAAAVGVTLRDLDRAARGVLDAVGAGSPFLDYRPDWAPTPSPPSSAPPSTTRSCTASPTATGWPTVTW